MMRNRRYRWLTAVAVGTTLVGAACGSGGGAGDGVASLSAGEQAAGDNVSDKSSESDKDPEEAMLDFAKCMREHGIDMPDPEFSGGGGGAGSVKSSAAIRIGGAGDVDMEKMEEANEACRPLLADAGPMREMSPEERQEMQDKAIEHSRCMREHGIDMPDPVFDTAGGGGAMVKIDAAGKGGIDFDSEEFQEASEACGEIFGGAVKGIKGGAGSFSVVTPSGSSK
jgi:hypothetical protein